MELVSPFSKTNLICGVLLVLVAVLGFTAVRADYLFSALNEKFATAVVMGFFGGNSIGVRDFSTPPGFIPLFVLFRFITLPFWAAILGVFPRHALALRHA